MTTQPGTILASEVQKLYSQYTGKPYRITVSLPLAYAATPGDLTGTQL